MQNFYFFYFCIINIRYINNEQLLTYLDYISILILYICVTHLLFCKKKSKNLIFCNYSASFIMKDATKIMNFTKWSK